MEKQRSGETNLLSPLNFRYWLQGYFEIGEQDRLSPRQIEIIQKHLALVKEMGDYEDFEFWLDKNLTEVSPEVIRKRLELTFERVTDKLDKRLSPELFMLGGALASWLIYWSVDGRRTS